MRVREEDLVQIVQWNAESIDPLQRSVAHVEDKLVTVAQFDHEAGGGLLEPRHWHTCAAGDDTHFVRGQRLGAGVVDVVLGVRLGGRPLTARRL